MRSAEGEDIMRQILGWSTGPEGGARVENLRKYLATIPPGEISNPTEQESLLAKCWDDLKGDAGGMAADKLLGRMEQVRWHPPESVFLIERHGRTVLRSTRADKQEWTINVDQAARSCIRAGTGK